MFDPFYTTKKPGRGTGLGLSIVYATVLRAGGCISVESNPSRGTVFGVFLPACDYPAEMRPDEPQVPIGNGETILVVEDEETVRSVAQRILETLNYNVVSASNGVRALDLLEELETPVHLVLTDVVMPAMSGPELVQELKKRRGSLRFLFMSGYSDRYASTSLPHTDTPVLEKPFGRDALAVAVRNALDN